MSFVVDYKSLNEMQKGINNNCNGWRVGLETLEKRVDILSTSPFIKGNAADGIKSYLDCVHKSIIQSINLICLAHQGSYSKYYLEYTGQIDGAKPFHIPSDELDAIHKAISDEKRKQQNIDSELTRAVNGISDIFSVQRQDFKPVEDQHNKIIKQTEKLENKIQTLENNHYNKDFVDTESSIVATKAFIDDCLKKNRKFKSQFTPDSLMTIGSVAEFRKNVNAISTSVQNNYEDYVDAIENATEKVDAYDAAEKAKREKFINGVKFVVGTVGVVASVAAVVCTGGAATPLLLGTIGAVTGAVGKGVDLAGAEYIEKGNFKDMDWLHFGADVAAAGVIGFCTAYAGAKFGNWAENFKWAQNAAKSSSIVTRSLGKAGTGAIENIVEEGAKRYIESGYNEAVDVITGKTSVKDAIGNIKGSVVNPKEILKDAVTGGATGTVGEIFDSGAKKLHLDSKWLNNDNTIKRGAGAFVYKGAEKAAEGVTERFTEKLIDDGDISKAVDDALDRNKILNDVVKGGAKGAADYTAGHKAVGDKITKEQLKKDTQLMDKVTNSVVDDPKNWLDRGGSIYMDSEGKVTYKAKELERTNKWYEHPRDTLVVDNNKNPIYERSTIDETQTQIGGHFRKSTK